MTNPAAATRVPNGAAKELTVWSTPQAVRRDSADKIAGLFGD